MTPSNLPPGITESMIPGHRGEDMAFERWAEEVEMALEDYIFDALNENNMLNDFVEYKFFVDVDFHNIDPAHQAIKIEEYVNEYLEDSNT